MFAPHSKCLSEKPPMQMTKGLLSKGARHSSRPHKQHGTGIWNWKEQQDEVGWFLVVRK